MSKILQIWFGDPNLDTFNLDLGIFDIGNIMAVAGIIGSQLKILQADPLFFPSLINIEEINQQHCSFPVENVL